MSALSDEILDDEIKCYWVSLRIGQNFMVSNVQIPAKIYKISWCLELLRKLKRSSRTISGPKHATLNVLLLLNIEINKPIII